MESMTDWAFSWPISAFLDQSWCLEVWKASRVRGREGEGERKDGGHGGPIR